MPLAVEPNFRVRNATVGGLFPAGEDQQPAINDRAETIVAQGLPELTELVRQGNSWQVSLATGLAALTALPTTTAGLSLWNGEPAGSTAKCYAIDSFGSVEEVIDATQADTTAIMVCNNVTPVTAPTDAGLAIRSLSGKKYGGKARTVSGGTITNDGWFGHGPQAPLAPAVAGANWKINETFVRGLYLVPPGGMFNVVAVKAGAAAAAQQFYFIRWHEVLISFAA